MPPPVPPRVRRAWYVVCWSHEARARPLRRTLFGEPLVVYRGADGQVGALVDRCPHRGVPLSQGRVVGSQLECPYHGWRFDQGGAVCAVPSLLSEPDATNRRATAYAVREQQGLVFVWGTPGETPDTEPFTLEHTEKPGYTVVREEVRARASVHAVVENALDVPHTAYLHGGLFRTPPVRNRITARVRRWHDRVEAEYIGEPRPTGILARFLSPSGGIVIHFDRFFLPSVLQVEYRLGDENHVVVTGLCTPAADYDTRLYAVIAARTRVPGFLLRLGKPLGLRVFHQDAAMLEQQTSTLEAFGDEVYASTDVDLLGPHVLKLLRRAERDELGDPQAPPWEKEVEMEV